MSDARVCRECGKQQAFMRGDRCIECAACCDGLREYIDDYGYRGSGPLAIEGLTDAARPHMRLQVHWTVDDGDGYSDAMSEELPGARILACPWCGEAFDGSGKAYTTAEAVIVQGVGITREITRHSCGRLNRTGDNYCGGCGEALRFDCVACKQRLPERREEIR